MDYGKLGKPSLLFGPGQERRLKMVEEFISLEGKKVLDYGCGVGAYTQAFLERGAESWGADIDEESLEVAREESQAEFILEDDGLPFEDNFFDLVFSNEVLEHVGDEEEVVREMMRVLKPEGILIVFVPNKWFPFETHGMYIGQKYIFGNIPFLSWAPRFIRKVFASHVRIYTPKRIRKLFKEQEIVGQRFVYPAFDRIQRECEVVGGLLKRVRLFLEKTPVLRRFGISIMLVVEKKN